MPQIETKVGSEVRTDEGIHRGTVVSLVPEIPHNEAGIHLG
jgi:hypothetical protein